MGSPVRYTISRIISHPGFRYHGSFPNDMALIQLSQDADLTSEFIDTIALADENEQFDRSACMLIGWGRLYPGGKLPNILQEVTTFIQTDAWCKDFIGYEYHPSHLCAFNHGHGVCDGDSGGSAFCDVGGVWKLVGAASFTYGHCYPTFPSVFSSVSYMRSWIRDNTGV